MTEPSLPPTIKVFNYLTVIPGRHPEQKVHASVGHAKNAIHQRRRWNSATRGYTTTVPMQIYENRDGEWVLLYDIPSGSDFIDLPWNKED